MTTKNVTLSIEETELARAQATARGLGLSFSAYMAKLARADQRRRNGAQYRRVMVGLTSADRAFQDGLSANAERAVGGVA